MATLADATPTERLTRGHKKKARTRTLLLDTAMEVLAAEGEGFSVADIAARAGVSHGTFYNYFTGREHLIAELVPYIVESFAAQAAVQVADDDPAVRFADISARALAAAVTSPNTVRVAIRVEAAQRALLVDGPLRYLRHDLEAGASTGRFVGPATDGTLDVVLGALLLAARRIIDGAHDAHYRVDTISRLLMALGVAGPEARQLAADAVDRSGHNASPPAGAFGP